MELDPVTRRLPDTCSAGATATADDLPSAADRPAAGEATAEAGPPNPAIEPAISTPTTPKARRALRILIALSLNAPM
ncbi:hypothetical protein GCM10010274_65170 [Streptomyces lavendofoliae]|uniref:Uncharacterized protein n=1 Tax=Streptomyces lavendofoliae TaxID=67314 RepID=A0A918M7M6_9ACTN|nr:hypothetical protein GCM10010274_65170 [Streptomyces lavendofoliae]